MFQGSRIKLIDYEKNWLFNLCLIFLKHSGRMLKVEEVDISLRKKVMVQGDFLNVCACVVCSSEPGEIVGQVTSTA